MYGFGPSHALYGVKGPASIEDDAALAVAVAAFEALYLLHWDRLVRRAYLVVWSVAAAEDVVQDAFSEVYLRWDTLRDPSAYISRVVVHGAIRRAQLEAREHDLDQAPDRLTMSDTPDFLRDAMRVLPRGNHTHSF